MSWTKGQLVDQAYEELGLASYFYDLDPDQKTSALRKMDAMISGWPSVRISYNASSSPSDVDADDDAGVPDYAVEAIYLNLALRLAPSVGKTVTPETKTNARMAYNALLVQAAQPVQEVALASGMPRGAGQKYWRGSTSPFASGSEDTIDAGSDGEINFE